MLGEGVAGIDTHTHTMWVRRMTRRMGQCANGVAEFGKGGGDAVKEWNDLTAWCGRYMSLHISESTSTRALILSFPPQIDGRRRGKPAVPH